MSLPSMTDASESKKKLQCAWSRPSSASERCAGVIAELQEREPAMADLLAEHADGVVLAEEHLQRIVRVLADPVHHRVAAQPSGAAEVARGVELRRRRCRGSRWRPSPRTRTHRRRPSRRSRSPAGRSCRGATDRTCAPPRPCRAGPARRTARRRRRRRRSSAVRAEVDRREVAGAAGREADDGLGRASTVANFISIEPSGRSVSCALVVRVESKPRTPHHVTVYWSAAAFAIDAAVARARVEIGKERGDARRAGQQPRDVAIGARAVLLLERDVAVGVDERRGLRLPVEGEAERRRSAWTLSSSVSVRRCAEARPEGAIDAADVIAAGAVAGESQAEVAEIVGVRRLDQIAFILNDGDLADVDRIGAGGEARRAADPPRA